MEDLDLASNFYVLQAILEYSEPIRLKQESEFKEKFENTCNELVKKGFTIEKNKLEREITNPAISFLNSSTLGYEFGLLLKKDGRVIEPNKSLFKLPYSLLLTKLK